nr:preprotein translocase subunit SecG [bacterium]
MWTIILGIILIICDIILVAAVMLQKSDDDGMNALSGARAESSMPRRMTGLEAKLPLITKVTGVLVAVLSVIMVVIS